MSLSTAIARRYLFSNKSSHLINFITGISVIGITVGTAALILVMSVFNGFQDVIYSLFNTFNPDLKISPRTGKVFSLSQAQLDELRGVPGILGLSRTLEETALFEYEDNRDFGKIKGVDQAFSQVTLIDSMLTDGINLLADTTGDFALVGHGMDISLNTNIEDQFTPLTVYVPGQSSATTMVSGGQGFVWRHLIPTGVFSIQQDFDNEYILAPLPLCQELLNYDEDQIGALELKIDPQVNVASIKSSIQRILGEELEIRNKYEQEEAFILQSGWALQRSWAVIIHSRNALDRLVLLIRAHFNHQLSGIFHCFSGSYEQAVAIIEQGFYLGIGGVVTYKNCTLPTLLKTIGLERVVLETDAPYLSPVPYRGKRNEPAYLTQVIQTLATTLGVSYEQVVEQTTYNAHQVFKSLP